MALVFVNPKYLSCCDTLAVEASYSEIQHMSLPNV